MHNLRTDALVELFLAWCARHRAPATVRFYRQRLARFVRWFANTPAAELTSLAIDEYLHAAGEGQSDSTRRHNAVALQSLQAFALREKLIPARIFETLEKPRIGRRERVPTPDEIERLLAHADPAFRRIYRALCQSGARPGELCRATIADVDWPQRAIVLREHKTARKTGKPRVIPIGDRLAEILREAIGARGELEAASPQAVSLSPQSPPPSPSPIFLTRHGKPWTPQHLSAAHRRLRDRAGLDREIVLYLARHRFGTELIRRGEDIKTVADLMGHASITTTQRYVHRDVRELRGKQDLID